jgi:hypothetical protein
MDEMSKLVYELNRLNECRLDEAPTNPFLVRDTKGREVKDDQSSAVVYVQTEDDSTKRYIAKGYSGRRGTADFYYRYPTLEKMNKDIENFFARVRSREKSVVDRRQQNNKPRDLDIGDILVASWGYNMTLVDCFQVVKLIGDNSVGVKPISKEYMDDWNGYYGHVKPRKNAFISNEITKYRVIRGDSIKINSSARAIKWDGKSTYYENHMD